ncbi:MAG: hypothetical protein AAF533_20165 [Acidobacteriota bacterium]
MSRLPAGVLLRYRGRAGAAAWRGTGVSAWLLSTLGHVLVLVGAWWLSLPSEDDVPPPLAIRLVSADEAGFLPTPAAPNVPATPEPDEPEVETPQAEPEPERAPEPDPPPEPDPEPPTESPSLLELLPPEPEPETTRRLRFGIRRRALVSLMRSIT